MAMSRAQSLVLLHVPRPAPHLNFEIPMPAPQTVAGLVCDKLGGFVVVFYGEVVKIQTGVVTGNRKRLGNGHVAAEQSVHRFCGPLAHQIVQRILYGQKGGRYFAVFVKRFREGAIEKVVGLLLRDAGRAEALRPVAVGEAGQGGGRTV